MSPIVFGSMITGISIVMIVFGLFFGEFFVALTKQLNNGFAIIASSFLALVSFMVYFLGMVGIWLGPIIMMIGILLWVFNIDISQFQK